MNPEEIHRRVKYEQRRLENKLDRKLGFYYWRTYWATSMWANLATPLNLGITIFTALMTVHSSSGSSFISDSLNMQINIATFFISIINTFFTPQKQYTDLNEYLCQWTDLGNKFEQVVFSDSEPSVKINEYSEILNLANKVHKDQFSKHRNFVTDLLHILVRTIFMNSNDRWMSDGSFDFYDKIQTAGIELEFDYREFKYSYKKANLLERLCYCFSCCFKHETSPEVSKHEPRVYDTITVEDYKNSVENQDIELDRIQSKATLQARSSALSASEALWTEKPANLSCDVKLGKLNDHEKVSGFWPPRGQLKADRFADCNTLYIDHSASEQQNVTSHDLDHNNSSRHVSQEESYENPLYDINIIGTVPTAHNSSSIRSQSLTI